MVSSEEIMGSVIVHNTSSEGSTGSVVVKKSMESTVWDFTVISLPKIEKIDESDNLQKAIQAMKGIGKKKEEQKGRQRKRKLQHYYSIEGAEGYFQPSYEA
jgi:hypothetical protein